MCNLTKKSRAKSKTGWKIVAVNKKGNYYSLAMGCKYPKNGRVPVVREQKQISNDFVNDILTGSMSGYCEEMVGRTAIFLVKGAAQYEIRRCTNCILGYTVEIKKAIISDDIMLGNYGWEEVAAGRHIKFLE